MEEVENEEKKCSKNSNFLGRTTKFFLTIFSSIKRHKISTSDKIGLFAVSLGVVSLISDCSQNNKIETTQYKLSQNEYRANVKIADFKIKEINLSFIDSSYRENNFVQNQSIDTNLVQDVPAKLKLSTEIYLTNIGNSRAKLYAEFYSDTTSGEYFLKKIVIKPKEVLPNMGINSFTDYYPISEINPGDTIILKRNFNIQHVNDKSFTLHILLFYENELNQVFDTYFWNRFEINDLIVDRFVDFKNNTIVTKVKKSDLQKLVKRVDFNSSSSIYTENQAKKIHKIFKMIFT